MDFPSFEWDKQKGKGFHHGDKRWWTQDFGQL